MTDQAGFNQWTVPWVTPDLPELDAIRAGDRRLPEFSLSAAQIDTYQRDGVLYLESAFTDWVDPLRAGLERNLRDPGSYRFPAESTASGDSGRFFDSYCNWPLIPEYRDFVVSSEAASLAGQAMQSSVAQLFHEHAFIKEPGTQRATPWHQDIPYYTMSGDQGISVYIALDDADEDTAVRFVRGSHRWGKIYYPKVFLDGADFNTGEEGYSDTMPDIAGNPGDYDIISKPLNAGDTILFSFKTVHGTTNAEVRRRRRAFSTRWMGDDARYLERKGEASPPFPEPVGMRTGDPMREDWFPVLWRR